MANELSEFHKFLRQVMGCWPDDELVVDIEKFIEKKVVDSKAEAIRDVAEWVEAQPWNNALRVADALRTRANELESAYEQGRSDALDEVARNGL